MSAKKPIKPGTPFDRLVVVGAGEPYTKPCGKQESTSVCICACGATVVVRNTHLKTVTRSCGCLAKETTSLAKTTHGHTRGYSPSGEYTSWVGMIGRTTNPNNQKWGRYGGRGITVCERWLNSFENFYADMGPKPTPKHSIDRTDNSGHYCPENCRWATHREQNDNREVTIRAMFYGKDRTLREWAAITQVPFSTISSRLKAGWPERFAFWAPAGSRLKDLIAKYPHHVPPTGL